MDKTPFTVPTTAQHCKLIAPHLREIDKAEAWAQGAMKPIDALVYSMSNSERANTVFLPDSDIPIIVYGITKQQHIFDRRRTVWLLGTNRIKEVKRQFIEQSGQHLQKIAAGQTVFNYVMQGNRASLHWLKILGFSIMEPEPHGWLNKPFHYVFKEVGKCA